MAGFFTAKIESTFTPYLIDIRSVLSFSKMIKITCWGSLLIQETSIYRMPLWMTSQSQNDILLISSAAKPCIPVNAR